MWPFAGKLTLLGIILLILPIPIAIVGLYYIDDLIVQGIIGFMAYNNMALAIALYGLRRRHRMTFGDKKMVKWIGGSK